MANRAIGALIIAGCLKIANTPELNQYCGTQLQPGGEGSIEYINEYLPTKISDPQELMRISIDAQRGFDKGWNYEEMGIGPDNLPVLQMTPPINFEGVPINLDVPTETSIKTFLQNFKNVLCFMKQYFSGLSPIAQFQAALMAVGAVRTLGQVVDATRRTMSAVTVGINGIFDWWRSVGKTPEATNVVKSVIQSMGLENVEKAISDGGGTKAYDEFVKKNKDFFTSIRDYNLMKNYDKNISRWPGRSFKEIHPGNKVSYVIEGIKQTGVVQNQRKHDPPDKLRITPDNDIYLKDDFVDDNLVTLIVVDDYERDRDFGGSKRKRTKRRKQSKKKTKRRKTYNKRRTSSSRKR